MGAINASRIIRFAISYNESADESVNSSHNEPTESESLEHASSDNLGKMATFLETESVKLVSVTGNGVSRVTIRTEEAVIISVIMCMWIFIILIFIKQWGKIRMLEPYQPNFVAASPESPVAGPKVKTTMTVNSSRPTSSSGPRTASVSKSLPTAAPAAQPPPFMRPVNRDIRISFPSDELVADVNPPCCATCGQPRNAVQFATIAQVPKSNCPSDKTMSAMSLSVCPPKNNLKKHRSVEDVTLYLFRTRYSSRSLLLP
ncbi:hypothetical protein HDE_12130 [Halotydeus destructor]|nr:hypothetical protein HDE_12130 [Halotydeus destructor]